MARSEIPSKILEAIRSGDAAEIRRAFNPFFESLVVSTPYIFAGLAVALGFRVGLFNIGAEGQLFIGAATTVTAAIFLKGLTSYYSHPNFAAGRFLWRRALGFIPGWLKAKTGGHEVINTIMMNYIAFRLSEFLLRGPLKDPEGFSPVSARNRGIRQTYSDSLRIQSVSISVSLSPYWLPILVYIFLFKTTWGYTLRTVGANPRAAKYAGMNIVRSTVIAMFLSGGLAGLAGANEVLGVNHNLALAFSSGYGFDAIALALLGKEQSHSEWFSQRSCSAS